MKLLYFFLIFFILGLPLEALQQNRFAQEKSPVFNKVFSSYTVSNAVEMEVSGNNPCFIYGENSSLTTNMPHPEGWSYYHSNGMFDPEAVPEADFMAVPGSAGNASLDFGLFFAEPKDAGFYAFRSGDDAVLFYIDGIESFTATPAVAQLGDGKPAEFRLKVTMHSEVYFPEAVGMGDGIINYQITNYAAAGVATRSGGKDVRPDAAGNLQAGKDVLLLASMLGKLNIDASGSHGNKEGFNVTLEVVQEPEPFLVLLNANDSNHSSVADFEEPFEQPVRDPDLMHLPPPLSMLEQEAAFQPVNGVSARLVMEIPEQVSVYASRFKDPVSPARIQGTRRWEMELTPENREEVLQEIAWLYVEGVRYSKPGDNAQLRLYMKRGEEILEEVSWRVVVLHFRMNPSMPSDYYPAPEGGEPVPRIKNPAFITMVPDAAGMDGMELERLSALFELQSYSPMLLNYFRDSIEWNIATEGQGGVESVDTREPMTVGSPFRGTRLSLYGTSGGRAVIGVRLRGMTTDYLRYRVPVGPIKEIPLCLQFFISDDASRQQALLYARQFPAILSTMNLLGRQAGVCFTPVDTAQAQFRNLTSLFDITLTDSGRLTVRGIPHLVNLTASPLWNLFPVNREDSSLVYTLAVDPAAWRSSLTARLRPEQGPSYVQFEHPVVQGQQYPLKIALAIPDMPPPEHFPNGIIFHPGTPEWMVSPVERRCREMDFTVEFNTPDTRMASGIYSTMALSSIPHVVTFNFASGVTRMPTSPCAFYGGNGAPHIVTANTAGLFVTIDGAATDNILPCLRNERLAVVNYPLVGQEDFLQQNTLKIARHFISRAFRSLGLQQRNLNGELRAYGEDQDALELAVYERELRVSNNYYTYNSIVPYTDITDDDGHFDDLLTDAITRTNYRIDFARTALLRTHPWLQEEE